MKSTVCLPDSKRGRPFPTAAAAIQQWFFLLAFLAFLVGPAGPAGMTQIQAQTGECDTVHLEAIADTSLWGSKPTFNYGASTSLDMIGDSGSTMDRGVLMKWDLSSIPPNAIVSTASISLNVTDPSTIGYPLYAMQTNRAWTETGATWKTYDGTNSWGAAGAQSTADSGGDRYNINLWGANSTTFSTIGNKTIALASDGIAVVHGWISTPAANYGVTIQQYSEASDNLIVSSREDSTPANRPTLNLTYCLPA